MMKIEMKDEWVLCHVCKSKTRVKARKDLGEKREKESGLEMQQPADQWSEEMRGIRDTRRERIKQGGDGSHPQDHE